MRTLSCLVLICTLAAAEEDRPSLRFGLIRVEGTRVVGTILQEGKLETRQATVRVTTSEGDEEHEVQTGQRERLFVIRAKAEPTRVALEGGDSIRIQAVHREPPDSLVRNLLFLTDPAYKGRVAGSMESFKLANELRGMLFKTGSKPIAWPTVPIPRPKIHGTRALSLIDSEDNVTQLPDSYFPFHLSARPRSGAVFKSVVSHPAEEVRDALVLLPDSATVEMARGYVERGAAVVAVVSAGWAERDDADWSEASGLAPGSVLRAGGPPLRVPYLSLSPDAAKALAAHGGKGVVKFHASIESLTTSNIVGVFGNPRERGILLSASWDGIGPEEEYSVRDATSAAVLLWVAEQLKRDFDRGMLKRPVVLALLGARLAGGCGAFQFNLVLRSPDTPVARPTCDLALFRLTQGTVELIHEGSAGPEFELLNRALEKEGLDVKGGLRPHDGTGLSISSEHKQDPVDLDTLRRTARAVYRAVRELASD